MDTLVLLLQVTAGTTGAGLVLHAVRLIHRDRLDYKLATKCHDGKSFKALESYTALARARSRQHPNPPAAPEAPPPDPPPTE